MRLAKDLLEMFEFIEKVFRIATYCLLAALIFTVAWAVWLR